MFNQHASYEPCQHSSAAGPEACSWKLTEFVGRNPFREEFVDSRIKTALFNRTHKKCKYCVVKMVQYWLAEGPCSAGRGTTFRKTCAPPLDSAPPKSLLIGTYKIWSPSRCHTGQRWTQRGPLTQRIHKKRLRAACFARTKTRRIEVHTIYDGDGHILAYLFDSFKRHSLGNLAIVVKLELHVFINKQ